MNAGAHYRSERVPREPLPPVPETRRVLTLVLPGTLLALACLLPFLNKAYTIDDPWFLLEARQILKTPLQPMSFPICWGNEFCLTRAGSWGPGAAQGLMGYLLVPVILAGGAEWLAHLLQTLIACLAVLEMVKLSLRLGCDRVQSAVAGLLLITIPPFLPMANTAMPDLLALALGLTGLERLLAWKDEHRWQQAALASLALGLAPYARPHLALLIPLGALWLFDELPVRKALAQLRRQTDLWTPVLVATLILIAVNVITRNRGVAAETNNTLVGSGHLARNLYVYLTYFSFPIPFAAVWLAIHWWKNPRLIVLHSIPAVILHFLLYPSKNLVQDWPTAAAAYGFTALVHMIYHSFRLADRLGILLSAWLLIPLPLIFYPHLPMKFMMAVLPAIVLIVIRTVASAIPATRARFVYATVAFVCAAFSCLLLLADYDFAEYGRKAAAELIAPHVAAGEKVWYGGEWGFYWYAQKAGARVSKPGEPGPNPGELLAVGLMEGGDVTRDRFPNRELVDSRRYDAPHGRTMGYGGTFYYTGYRPWVWSPKTTNEYQLWRIR